MHFKFNVNLTDKDYLDYNVFMATKSVYGKKNITIYRIVLTVFFVVVSFISLAENGFSVVDLIAVIPLILVYIMLQLSIIPIFTWSVKRQLASLNKSGKMGYSPFSVFEFCDEIFTEQTEYSKSEVKYSTLERISVVDKKLVYLHVSNVGAYILPIDSFGSMDMYNQFMEFIKTKCQNVDIY